VELGRKNFFFVHELVLLTYVGPRPDGMLIRHLDGDPSNNRLDNLKYGSPAENYQDQVEHGTNYLQPGGHHPHAKLDPDKVLEIIRLYKDEGLSQEQIAALFGVDPTTINAIIKGRSWSSLTGIHYSPTPNPKAQGQPRKKLSDDDVRGIRKLYQDGRRKAEIARVYGVSPAAIKLIVENKRRTNVT